MENSCIKTLAEYFGSEGIKLFAACPARCCTVTKEYLMKDEWSGGSVLFVLVPYYTPPIPGSLPMSAYAAVHDYHAYMTTLLGGAATLLDEKYPGSVNTGFADHSPVDERRGAAAAGLGVLGKNGLLITEAYSSFVFIGEIITTLGEAELLFEGVPTRCNEPKACISCGRCADACPGKCIGEGRGNCVSAVTQKKGELTEDEKSLLRRGGSVWGCDACQNACPYTNAAMAAGTLVTNIPYFRDSARAMTRFDIGAMSDEEYRRYPFSWRKKEVLLRNIDILFSDTK